MCSSFFFQAEDGIRDLTVTGVQTCALPIGALLDLSRPPEVERHRILERAFLQRNLDDARRVAMILEARPASRLGFVGIDRERLVAAPARMRDVIDAAAQRPLAPAVDNVERQG